MILAQLRRLAILLIFLVGCTSSSSRSALEGPTADWPVSTPSEQGMNPEILDEMLVHIDDIGVELHSLLIVRNGQIILEKYYPGHQRDELHVQYSVTKSFVATLFGIALDQGKLSGVDLKVRETLRHSQFANPDLRKEAISLENLLTMSSGLDWIEADQTYSAMYLSKDWVDYVMGLPVADDPGKSFRYCSGCSHVLLKIIEQAVGLDAEKYAKENLFRPLGIQSYKWERTPQGDLIGGWGLYLTSRDMAKLGYLFLHDGEWAKQQVVSKAWVRNSIMKRIDTDERLGYGYHWWIYPTHGAYAALGRDGQTIFVIPDLQMIVVTTAQIRDHDPIFEMIDNYIIPAVLY